MKLKRDDGEEMRSFNVKIPAGWVEKLKGLALAGERTLAGEIRVAVLEHLKSEGVA